VKTADCRLGIGEGEELYTLSRLYSLRYVKDVLEVHGIRLKKSLGQNILFERGGVDKLVDAAGIGPEDVVLEVGPGMGHLTRALLERARHVVGIEIDRRMLPILKGLLGGFGNFTLAHADVLKVDLRARFAELGLTPTCVVANVPYYISTPIVEHLAGSGLPFRHVTMTLQKELAVRYIAEPGTRAYGSVTVAVALWGVPRIAARISARCFFPRPKIDSVVLRIELHARPPAGISNPAFVQRVVRAAFSQRRKMLKNTLRSMAGAGFNVAEALVAAGIDPAERAENLSLADFARLSDRLIEHASDQLQQSE